MSIEPPAPSAGREGAARAGDSAGGPGPDDPLKQRLRERLRSAGARGLSRAELAAAAGGEAPEGAVDAALAALRAAGHAAPWRDRWRAAEAAGWLRGRVEAPLPGGGARVAAGDNEFVVGGGDLSGAAVGDEVLTQPLRGRRRMIAGRSLPEAAVVAVLGGSTQTRSTAMESTPVKAREVRSRGPLRAEAAPPPPAGRRRPSEARSPAEPTPPGAGGRRQAPAARVPPEDVLPAVAVVGAVAEGEGGRTLVPFDSREPELTLDGARGLPIGHFVVAAPERPAAGERPARVRVTEALGDPEVPGVDTEVVLRHHRIPRVFPEAALAEAEALPAEPQRQDLRGRLDLRDATVVTIDGADARDFDDALSIEPLGDRGRDPAGGGWRLGVHIADVAHYVAAGGALDREAERRGTSVYFPGRVVPMLPEPLSAGLCSLRPGVPRLTMSVFLEIGRDGRTRRRRFAESVIASARRLTYEEVRRLLEEERPADARDYGPVLPLLHHLGELMAALNRRRCERGSLDFDLPEGDVELDTDGTTVGVQPAQRTVAHRIVEEAMIAANEAVAEGLERAGVPALYRVHDPPAAEDLETLAAALDGVGLELRVRGAAIAPVDLARVQRRAAGQPWEGFVNSLLMRALRAASYSAENRRHFALASRHYTHFTSPIRRYPDLVVHRSLKALIRGGAEAARAAAGGDLPAIAAAASEAERRATRAERDLLQWKKVRFLAGRVGETFPGRITGVQPYGLFVQLDRYLVDGLVPVRTLGREFFRFDSEGHRLVGASTGRAFQLGDPVTVTLEGVSAQHRGLDLVLAEELPRPPRGPSP